MKDWLLSRLYPKHQYKAAPTRRFALFEHPIIEWEVKSGEEKTGGKGGEYFSFRSFSNIKLEGKERRENEYYWCVPGYRKIQIFISIHNSSQLFTTIHNSSQIFTKTCM